MMCYETAISHMPILGRHPRLRIRAPPHPGFNTQGMECRVLYPGDPSDSTFKGQEPTDGTPSLRVKCHLSPGKKADHHTETSQINIPFQILGGFNWPCSSGVGFWGSQSITEQKAYPGAKRARIVTTARSTKSALELRKLNGLKRSNMNPPSQISGFD